VSGQIHDLAVLAPKKNFPVQMIDAEKGPVYIGWVCSGECVTHCNVVQR